MSVFDKYDDKTIAEIDREPEIDYEHTNPDSQNQDINEVTERSKWHFFTIVAAVIFLVLGFRLFQIQIINGHLNASLAAENSIRQIQEPASRGLIFDSRGVWLARNAPSFSVELSPSDLPASFSARQTIYNTLAKALNWSEFTKNQETKTIENDYMSYQSGALTLANNLSHDQALILTEELANVQATTVAPQQTRQYNFVSDGMAHILGYVGKFSASDLQDDPTLRGNDVVGKDGLEKSYNQYLKGKDGVEQVVVDNAGKVVETLPDQSQAPKSGDNLILNIDSKLQDIMAKDLSAAISENNLKAGVAIAMNPQNGAILAMVSLPTYDNNQFVNGISSQAYNALLNDPNQPLFDRAVMGTYAPGSTIKPMIATVGLQDGVITENTTINTPAQIQVGQWSFPNWQEFFIPNVDVKTAIANSNDIFFYALGGGWSSISGLGINRLDQGLTTWGFGQPTGIDLPNEAAGLVPTPSWKEANEGQSWYIGDTYHMSIGQGYLLVTPIQLITALSAIANGGTLYSPRLVNKIVDQNGNTVAAVTPKIEKSNFFSSKNIQIVREGMRQTVTNGSGWILRDLPVTSAAKTGTAQYGVNNQYQHSWFEAFAPFDNPTIAIVLLGEQGSQENDGFTTAEPVVNNILQQYFSPGFNK